MIPIIFRLLFLRNDESMKYIFFSSVAHQYFPSLALSRPLSLSCSVKIMITLSWIPGLSSTCLSMVQEKLCILKSKRESSSQNVSFSELFIEGSYFTGSVLGAGETSLPSWILCSRGGDSASYCNI